MQLFKFYAKCPIIHNVIHSVDCNITHTVKFCNYVFCIFNQSVMWVLAG